MTRPGWYPDPSGRFPKRWFDGTDWTASVLGNDGQQGYEVLPAAGAPTVPGLPAAPTAAAGSPLPPPPPPGATVPRPPAHVAGPPSPWQQSPTQPPTWRYDYSTSPAAWRPTSFGQPSRPVAAPARRRANPFGSIAVGIAVALWVLSLFVLDWIGDVSFSDLRDGFPPVEGLVDNVVKANVKWLAFAWAGLAVVATGAFVIGRVGNGPLGHVLAAVVAAVGAVMSTLVVVRIFRGPGPDPEFGAWLLPAGYLVLLAAIVVCARDG